MNNPQFELYKSSHDNQFYFRLRAPNWEIILSSEGYTTKQSCEHGIASVKQNAIYDDQYERKNIMGSYTFNLRAANDKVIGHSESYANAFNRDQGIASVKNNAPYASVVYSN